LSEQSIDLLNGARVFNDRFELSLINAGNRRHVAELPAMCPHALFHNKISDGPNSKPIINRKL